MLVRRYAIQKGAQWNLFGKGLVGNRGGEGRAHTKNTVQVRHVPSCL